MPAGCCVSVRAWHLLASHFHCMAKLFVPPNSNHFHTRAVTVKYTVYVPVKEVSLFKSGKNCYMALNGRRRCSLSEWGSLLCKLQNKFQFLCKWHVIFLLCFVLFFFTCVSRCNLLVVITLTGQHETNNCIAVIR